MTFQEAAVESAQLYYKFLEENGGGLITYRVSKIVPDKNSFKKNEFWLQLDQKPKNTDSLMIRIQNYVYSNEQIKPVVYNSHNRMQAMAPTTHQWRFRQLSATAPKQAMNGTRARATLPMLWNWDMVPAVKPMPVTVPINEIAWKGRNT